MRNAARRPSARHLPQVDAGLARAQADRRRGQRLAAFAEERPVASGADRMRRASSPIR